MNHSSAILAFTAKGKLTLKATLHQPRKAGHASAGSLAKFLEDLDPLNSMRGWYYLRRRWVWGREAEGAAAP
jgi:hypothetical protein